MAEKEDIYTGVKIKWVGIIDLGLFYKKIQEWLKIKKYNISEKRYVEKIKPNGKQIEFIWECSKKEAEYFKYEIKLEFYLTGVVEAEIEKNGKRLKLSKIEAEISIESAMTKDRDDEWAKKSPIMKSLYERFMIPHKIEEAKIDCYKDTADLIEEIKGYFELYSIK